MAADRFLEVYGSMGYVAGVVQTLYLATAFFLGVRLLRRAAHLREQPELLLGLHLLLTLGMGYLLVSAGVSMGHLSADPPREVIAPLLAVGYAATILGLMATLVFTWRVFQSGTPFGGALAALGSLAMWLGWLAYGASGGFSRGTFEGTAAWLLLGAMLFANGWTALVPLQFHLRMRRRVALGLADPLVADRFLLWGLGSLARVLMILMGPLAEHALERGASAEGWLPALTLALASALGLCTTFCFLLAFEPSGSYRRWVERRYAGRLEPPAQASGT